MLINHKIGLSIVFVLLPAAVLGQQKVLTLKDALQTALQNYGTVKAKTNYVNADKANVKQARFENLPDLNISAQQSYGTINSQFGPAYGYRGFSVASSGPALANQNWNAAFGSLYLANISWDFFAFGKARQKVSVATTAMNRDEADLNQELFQHEVRVSTAYLNLLAAQQLSKAQQKNLVRAEQLRNVVVVRAKNGLNAGVDSSLANAEVSSARIAFINARDFEQTQAAQLAQYLGIPPTNFLLDSVFITKIPSAIDTATSFKEAEHPVLKYYQTRVDYSDALAKYYKTFLYPTFSFFSTFQGRGSGFSQNYNALNTDAYTQSYFDGVNPTRTNYLLGLGMIWNLTSPLRVHQQVEAQHYTSLALKDEYNLIDQNLKTQMALSESRIQNALKNYREAPIGVKAASDAFLQKSVLYKNGLATIVDITQALYTVNRAETDQYIAYNNVWQALLYKAASSGNFSLFISEF